MVIGVWAGASKSGRILRLTQLDEGPLDPGITGVAAQNARGALLLRLAEAGTGEPVGEDLARRQAGHGAVGARGESGTGCEGSAGRKRRQGDSGRAREEHGGRRAAGWRW